MIQQGLFGSAMKSGSRGRQAREPGHTLCLVLPSAGKEACFGHIRIPGGSICSKGASSVKPLLILCAALSVLPALSCGCRHAVCLLPAAVLLLSLCRSRREIASLRARLEELERLRGREEARARAEAGEELERFRSVLSHELRTPIAVIQGYAELLESGMVPDAELAREYLRRIIRRSVYMDELLSRLRGIPSGEIGPLSRVRLDLAALIRQAEEDMRSAAGERGISIRTQLPAEPLTVEADACLLSQVLFNLLENAVKYMGRPGSVMIRAERRGAQALLTVRDDGMGLSQEEALHIFEPGYQGSNRRGGQGQGLSLVRRIAEAHGGTVSASAAPGEGMEISIALPLRPPPEFP